MASVMSELSKCNTDIVYIPVGMTFYLQPCDVYLNKPLKEKIKALWQSYMLDQMKESPGIFLILFIRNF